MNKELIINPDARYRIAEQKATNYYKSLYEQVVQKTYVPTLIEDIHMWKHNHIRHHSFLSFFRVERENLVPGDTTIISNG